MSFKGYRWVSILILILLSLSGCSESQDIDSTMGNTLVTPTMGVQDTSLNEITISKTEYFYSQSIDLELLSDRPGKIYYTTDGTDPSEDTLLYTEAIKLIAGDSVQATCIKVKAFYEDGSESDTVVHTYFVGKDAQDRYNTLVFSVITDPYNLYDNEYGIFVEGKLRADYIDENPGVKINPDAPANYNMRGKESEREVYLEVFESDGTKIIGQAAGIRTYGGWSRAREQKSVKIFARKEYDEQNNKFRYEFFPQKTSVDGRGNILDSFKQIVLRNCGNDNGFGFIRDELFQTLAGKAGYLDYEAVRPAALYVNGDYRGFFWLREVYCDEYFEDQYGKYNGRFEILEGGETFKEEDADGDNIELINEYTSMYDKFSGMDLMDEANYQMVCKAIDVKNYLEYYAFNVYINNEDWPHNNYKTYRYYPSDNEEYREAPFDGRWRYLLHDTDFSFGIYGSSPETQNIANYIGRNGEIKEASPLFGQLIKRDDCRKIFIKKTLDLMNGTFSSDHLNSLLEEMNGERLNELQHTYSRELLEDWVSPADLSWRLSDIKNYASARANYILSSYKDYFGLGNIYALRVKNVAGCKVTINSFGTETDFEGSYYTDYNTEISVIPGSGKELDYWIMNGTKVEGEKLIITASMVKDNVVEVSFVLK